MADWNKTRYSPTKSWSEMQRDQANANLEKIMPKKWWHDLVFGWGAVAVLTLGFGSFGLLLLSLL